MAIFPAQFVLTLALLSLPAVVSFGKSGLMVSARHYALSSLGVLGGYAVYWRISHRVLFPWMVNIISPVGILLSGLEMRGVRPIVLNRSVRAVVTLTVVTVLVRIGAVLLSAYESNREKIPYELPVVLQIFSVFGVIYSATLFFRLCAGM
jgi:hypothetical protein